MEPRFCSPGDAGRRPKERKEQPGRTLEEARQPTFKLPGETPVRSQSKGETPLLHFPPRRQLAALRLGNDI
jgi:hypothetical protein